MGEVLNILFLYSIIFKDDGNCEMMMLLLTDVITDVLLEWDDSVDRQYQGGECVLKFTTKKAKRIYGVEVDLLRVVH